MGIDYHQFFVDLRSLWNHREFGLLIIDEQLTIKMANQEFQQRSGYEESHLQEGGVSLFLDHEVVQHFSKLIHETIRSHLIQSYVSIRTAWHEPLRLPMTFIKLDPIENFQQKHVLVLVQFAEITDGLTLADAGVQRRIEDLSYVLDNVSSYAILTIDGVITENNLQFEQLIGYSAKEMVGKNYSELIRMEPWPPSHFDSIQTQLKEGLVWRGEVELKRKAGTYIWAQFVLIPLFNRDHETERVLAFCEDISKEKGLRDQLEFLAYHHQPTGLRNRNYMRDYLKQLMIESPDKTIFLYVIHVDPYEDYVRHMGHTRANEILKEVARRLTSMEKGNVLVAHSDTNEFLVSAIHMELDQLQPIVNQLMSIFSKPFYMENGLSIIFRITIGVSIYPDDAHSVSEMYRMALIALHRIPKDKKNVFAVFSSQDSLESYKAFALASHIHDALGLGEFEVWFQPKINIQTMQLDGAESLLRWKHPDWGIIHAGEFIPIIQEVGMLSEVSVWAFTTLCQTMDSWRKKGLKVPMISFNLPGSALIQVDLEENIHRIASQYHIPPSTIMFEITETEKIQDEASAIRTMQALRKQGYLLSLDDFGSGYSGLNYLRQFPVDEVKFDRHFLKEIVNDSLTRMIIQSSVLLSHSLNMRVVAEGIETEEQLAAARSLNVEVGQGYLWSPAVPMVEFERIIADPEEWFLRIQTPATIYTGPNRREFFRIVVEPGMMGQLSLYELKGKRVQSGVTQVVVINIGPGGLSFLSTLRLPAKNDVRMKMVLKLSDQYHPYIGHVVWLKEYGKGIIQYGFQFELEELEREKLISLLNQLAIHQRNAVLSTTGYDLIQSDIYRFFSKS